MSLQTRPAFRRLARLRVYGLASAFARDTRGATAIEFAFVAPVFFLFLFAMFEIALIVWFQSVLNDGAYQGANYLRNETMSCTRQGSSTNNCTAATVAGLRNTICQNVGPGGISCDRLKLAAYSADDLLAHPVTTAAMIDDVAIDLKTSRAYIIALGYEWPFGLPTSRLLLASSGSRVQLQARVYATTAEKSLR